MLTLEGMARILTELAVMDGAEKDALEKAAQVVETEAKRVIGTYDYGWAQLAPSTQKDREDKGYPANEPLLRDGTMRDSIQHKVEGKSAFVGSNEDIAVFQELGTSRIPPRPFLAGAAMHKGPEVAKIVGETVVGYLSGKKLAP